MLMSRPRTTSTTIETANVHNYYERLVTEAIFATTSRAKEDADFLADVTCVALNHLPPRYIRHDVDMVFFMSPAEREETAEKVQNCVDHAIDFVLKHELKKAEEQNDEADSETDGKAETSQNMEETEH